MPRPVEAHLGEVIGAIEPLRNVRKVAYRHPRWIENGSAVILAYVAVTVFTLLIVMAVWVALMFAKQTSLG